MPAPRKPYRIGHLSKAQRAEVEARKSGPVPVTLQPDTTPLRRAQFRPPPAIPRASSAWLDSTREWYASIGESPQSALFQASDWSMAVAAGWAYDLAVRNRNARLWSYFVTLNSRLGMTLLDRLDAAIGRAEERAATETDWHTRLMPVQD